MKKFKITSIAAAGALAGGLVFAGPVSTAFGKSGPASARTAHTGTSVSVSPGVNGYATAVCPAGKVVSGGGGLTSGINIYVTDSYQTGNGWAFRGTNRGPLAESITAEAICLG